MVTVQPYDPWDRTSRWQMETTQTYFEHHAERRDAT